MTDKTTIRSIAGYSNEQALWTLLADMTATTAGQSGQWIVPSPETVIVDGDHFLLDATHEPTAEFFPPEGISPFEEQGFVWSLGALVCYASSGHYVFGGHGGTYQKRHPKTALPTLRKEHSALTAVVKRCLCYTPAQRISVCELHDIAVDSLTRNTQKSRVKRIVPTGAESSQSAYADDVWPETMR